MEGVLFKRDSSSEFFITGALHSESPAWVERKKVAVWGVPGKGMALSTDPCKLQPFIPEHPMFNGYSYSCFASKVWAANDLGGSGRHVSDKSSNPNPGS